jgi:uncharacterized protein YqiB (DUF1249 family)
MLWLNAGVSSVYKASVKQRRYSIDLWFHMAECDANYMRLMKLMPNLAESDCRSFSLTSGLIDSSVHFEVIERCKYTTVVRVIQETCAHPQRIKVPEAEFAVRMYHDAKSAEVIESQSERLFEAVYDYPNPKMRQRDEKVQINRFLGEFLAACLKYGVSSEEPMTVS